MPDLATVQTILLGILGTGGLGAIVGAIRSWVRGRAEDESLETDLQERITAMADRWLEKAEKRLVAAEARAEQAEARAEQAEQETESLRKEFREYKVEKRDEQNRMLGQLQIVYDWIESGAQPPPPSWPSWLPRSPMRKNHHGV